MFLIEEYYIYILISKDTDTKDKSQQIINKFGIQKFKIHNSIIMVFYFFLINNSLITKVIIMSNFYKDLLYNFKKIKILFII